MNSSILLTLITCRDIFQTIYKSEDPLGQKYQDSAAIIWISNKDFAKTGLKDEGRVKLRNGNGEVVVLAKKDHRIPSGVGFMPIGPYANRLVGYNSITGWPSFKFERIVCEPTDEKILSVTELLETEDA